MSAWMLLPACSGYTCDIAAGWMRFAPQAALTASGHYMTPWFNQRGWGTYTQTRQPDGAWQRQVTVLGGEIAGLRIEYDD
jgi:hypothetical protein